MPTDPPVSAEQAANRHSEAASESARPEMTTIASKALAARPRFSIRMQIYATVALSLVILCGVAVALLVATRDIERKVQLLEISNSIVFEVQQARRFEKNYFLYGTNLADALENVDAARRILSENHDNLARAWRPKLLDEFVARADAYAGALERLEQWQRQSLRDNPSRRRQAESELRRHGQELVASAQGMMQREKAALDAMIVRSRRIHVYTFAFLFALFTLNTAVLGWRVLAPLRRFLTYADRIATGDYAPIVPVRSYRDEFSNLAISINHMVSELDRRQDIVVQSHKLRAVGTLTAGIAHELNNPINNISLTAHMLMEDYETLGDAERLDMVNDLVKEADRTDRIVRNLLDFARETKSTMEPLDLGSVVSETLALVGNELSLAQIDVDAQLVPHLPRVHGDRQQLQQVLVNLILNAIDVTPKGGRIQVLVVPAKEPNYVALKVTDFGPGIPPHVRSSIFDPFFTTKSKGAGLGLSICQGIVAKHGGTITVETKPNEGTSFTVQLPIVTFPADLEFVRASA